MPLKKPFESSLRFNHVIMPIFAKASYFAPNIDGSLKRILLFSLLLFTASAQGQNENDPTGARAAAMGGTSLGLTDVWAYHNNQAGLAAIESFTAGAFYENRFLVSGMSFQGFAVANPLGNGVVAVGYSGFGYSVYQENNVGAGYALNLTDNLSAGVRMNYHSTRIATDNYGRTGNVTAELGVQMRVSKNVTVSSHLFNPFRAQLNDFNDERLPTIIGLGAGYRISDELYAALEVEKDIEQKASFRAGVEYHPADILYVRVGTSSNPNLFSFGIGLEFNNLRFDLASSYHSLLGYTPQVSLTYLPSKK